ncbi:MAG: PAS domain S-box [Methanobacterium sp. Maddingley MBC34]|nr:MAG: PAS domain S-box [Methanobacterium sp. Maddingley MBC34]
MIGTDFSNYFTEPKKAEKGYQQVFKKGFVRDYPLKIQHKTGQVTQVLYNASIYKDESGDVVGVFAAARDITERLKSEEKIQMLANVVESSDDAIISKSLEGQITSWNKGAELIYGYSAEEIMGKDISILAPSQLKDEINQFIEKIKKGERILHYETLRVRKDGTKINVSLTLSPILNTSGDLVGISTIARDITQRKKTDDEILQAKEEWEHTFDSVPDLIAILDTNFRVVRANKAMANRLNVDPEEAIGLTCYNVVHGLNAPPSFCPYMKLLEDGQEHTAEVHEDRLGGDFIVSVSPLHDSDGNLIGSVHVARDITDRKKAEDKIKKSLKEKEVLLSEIHHRVKNNMQIISSLLSLQSQYVAKAETVDVLQESQDRVKAMATIYEKLSQSNDLTKINFESYMQSLIQGLFYSHTIKEGQINPIIKIENIMLNIETAIPCGLIISELVSNILKHAFPEGREGKMCVSLKAHDNRYELKISDDGIGFPEDIDFKTTDTLGLKLVNTLVKQIDGEITLDRSHGTEYNIIFRELEYQKRI